MEGHVDGDSTMLIGKLNPLGPLNSTALAAKLLRFTVSSLYDKGDNFCTSVCLSPFSPEQLGGDERASEKP